MTTALEIRDLFRVHSSPEGDTAALQGLSLRVEEGEVVVVLGPSGSGKTTLLRIVAGLERPSAGTVRVFGTDLGRLPARRLSTYRSATLGYADQHYTRALAPDLRARDLVSVALGLRGAPRAVREARADELLERVGLLERRLARPRELSGGEQQRLAVCAAVAARPRLLLADEPTGELDAASAAAVYELLRELATESGSTTLAVSHDAASARVADRVVHVRDGRVSAEEGMGGGVASIVVQKGGWVHLPEELLHRAGIDDRANATVEDGHIRVTASAPPRAAAAAFSREAAAAPAEGLAAALRDASQSFGAGRGVRHVLSGLSREFPRGRVVAVTGPSGSGKTTLLRLLAGLDLPSAGEVEVAGLSLAGLDRAARAAVRRRHVGFVAQSPELVPFLTARENVELALELRGAAGDGAAEAALAAVGVEELAGQRVGRLSAGERQRVAVARAVATRPALLLADEPTARLDGANALALAGLLARLAKEWGTGVVCATHDPYLIDQADEKFDLVDRPPA